MDGEEPIIADMLDMAERVARREAETCDFEEVRDFLALDVTIAVRRYLAAPQGELRRLIGTVVLNRIRKVRERRSNREGYLNTNERPVIQDPEELDILTIIRPELLPMVEFLLTLGRKFDPHQDGLALLLFTGMNVDEARAAMAEVGEHLAVLVIEGHGIEAVRVDIPNIECANEVS